jgi:hypothetical protein
MVGNAELEEATSTVLCDRNIAAKVDKRCAIADLNTPRSASGDAPWVSMGSVADFGIEQGGIAHGSAGFAGLGAIAPV